MDDEPKFRFSAVSRAAGVGPYMSLLTGTEREFI